MLTEVAKQQNNINSDTAQFVDGVQLEIALLLLEFALECLAKEKDQPSEQEDAKEQERTEIKYALALTIRSGSRNRETTYFSRLLVLCERQLLQ